MRGAVALLTLNRPEKLNALSNELLDAIAGTLDKLELEPSVRAVVITGAGRAFSAGADIAAFQPHVRGVRAVHRGLDASIDDGLAIEEAAFARIAPTYDAQEGVAAFVEKRSPVFLGR